MQTDTFEAAGHTFHVPGFDALRTNEKAVLKAYIALTLESYQKYGAAIAPNVTEVLARVIESGETGIASMGSRAQAHSAVKVLEAKGLLAKKAGINRHPCHWPAMLEVRPAEKFLAR
jgi:hypothetical protein